MIAVGTALAGGPPRRSQRALIANAGLVLIDVLDGDGWWFDWIAVPWGIFLVGHAIVVFAGRRLFGAEWEQRKVTSTFARTTHGTADPPVARPC